MKHKIRNSKSLIISILMIIALTFAVWTLLFRHDNILLRIISSVCLILIGLGILLSEK